MSSVRDWTTGFAMIGAEVLIDFLKEKAVIAAIAVCAVVAGMIGWVANDLKIHLTDIRLQ